MTSLAIQKSLLALLFAASAFAAPAPGDSAGRIPAPEPRFPADIVYAREGHADSAVVFSHPIHFMLAGNTCTACHPATFHMLTRGPEPTHRDMNAGASCGTCHNGRDAFGTTDATACATCHTGPPKKEVAAAASAAPGGATAAAAPAAPRVPKPHAYPRAADSPGRVTFQHATHAKAGCATCHPQPFQMKAAPPLPDFGMHGESACGKCHDGKAAFAAEDPANCDRCHKGEGATP